MKYKYNYKEWSQDTRDYEIKSEKELTLNEIIDIASGCTLIEGHCYKGGKTGERFFAEFKGTEYGDDTQTDVTGSNIKED